MNEIIRWLPDNLTTNLWGTLFWVAAIFMLAWGLSDSGILPSIFPKVK